MTNKEKAAVALVAAVAGQVYLGRVAKQQAAVLGLPVVAVALLALAASTAMK